MNSRRFLATGFLVVMLVLCFAVAAFAVPAPDEALQPVASAGSTVEDGAVLAGDAAVSGDQAAAVTQPGGQLSGSTDYNDTKDGQNVPQSSEINENTNRQADDPSRYPVLGAESVSLSPEEQQMLGLVNHERAAGGVGALQADSSLARLARLKAQDMVDNRYFDHNSPTYGSPFDMMKRFGISYSFAGENLAMAPSVPSAHKALMESPGHRANIMNGNFDRVGIGIVVTGGYRYCVQMFTGGQQDAGNVPDSPGGSIQQPQQPGQSQNTGEGLTADEALMVQLINQKRARAGLPQVSPDGLLFKVARLKARDFVENNYFAHTSPTYGTLREMLNSFGAKYTSAGETLALSTSVTRAHNALMNSSGNRAAILNSRYRRVGIGIAVKGSNKYFVQIYTDGRVSQPPSGGATQPPAGDPPKPPSGGATSPGDTGTTDPGAAGLTAEEQRMLNLVNSERAKNGLSPLKANLKLTQVARLKAKDMIEKNYFSHTSPTYGSPFDMMRQFGVTYRTAGENLAGAPTVDTAHTNLMNSPGHRANILNSSFKEVGMGILSGGPYGKMFVQMFIG